MEYVHRAAAGIVILSAPAIGGTNGVLIRVSPYFTARPGWGNPAPTTKQQSRNLLPHGPEEETICGATDGPCDLLPRRPACREAPWARMFALFGVEAVSLQQLSAFHRISCSSNKVRDIAFASTSIHPITPSCCASTRRARFRRSGIRHPAVLPLGLGHIEGVTDEFIRHGTTTLSAALDIANGRVLTQCRARHRHQDFWGFVSISRPTCRRHSMRIPSSSIPLPPENTEKRAPGSCRPAALPSALHAEPNQSRLNQVERWFALLTQRQIRRGLDPSARKTWSLKSRPLFDAYNAQELSLPMDCHTSE